MSLPEFMEDECVSGPPVGIAVVNGTADPQVPYQGGWITVFRKKRDIVLSTSDTLTLWRNRNGCAHEVTQTHSFDKPGDNTSVGSVEWSNCSGALVKLYKVNNGGHTWPGGVQYLPARVVGETSADVNASDLGWAFFSQFR
ncbi:MAG: PHB depolymerase family esterase [Halioglobus sp.]